MKSLKLKSILLVSHREKRARKIEFHPQVTVIKGLNDTGKSSLIKSIYYTFGAEPHGIHHRWQNADVITLVSFALDGVDYSIYRHRKSFSLFNADNFHLGTYGSVTNELAPVLSKLFDFKLKLLDRDDQSSIPPPAFLLLPFYIDQDKGWVSTWNSFKKLGQYPNWKQRVISYHFGIKPDKWYEFEAEKKAAALSADEPQRQYNALKLLKDKTREQIARVDFDIDFEAFKKEIDSLISECNKLKNDENVYRIQMSKLKTEKIKLEAQIEIVRRTHDELSNDYKFAMRQLDNVVGCPTCGATYSNSFSERFEIAQDTETCVDLLTSLSDDLRIVTKKIYDINISILNANKNQKAINSILSQKQGKIKLHDLIRLEGKRSLFDHLNSEMQSQESLLNKINELILQLQEKMKEFDDPVRRKTITERYGKTFSRNSIILDVSSLNENVFRRIDCSIEESGSDMPRALLAYFYSALEAIQYNGNATFFPIVIDAPNQQEQDKMNLNKMLKFIKSNSSTERQLVLGMVDDCGIDFGGKVIELKTKDYLLNEADYLDLSQEIKCFEVANLGLE